MLARVVIYAQCFALVCLAALARFEGNITPIEPLHPTLYSIVWGFGTVLVLAIFIWPILLIAALVLSWKKEKHPLIVLAAGTLLEAVYIFPVAMVCH